MKPILTKEENVNLYLKNFMQLGEALMNAGGNSFMVLKQYDDFLRTLAANNIEVTAKYNYPEETMPLKTTGENEMIFYDEVDQKMTEEGYNEFGEYILSPKNLELQKKWREKKAKFDEDFAKIGIRRDSMWWQKPLSTSKSKTMKIKQSDIIADRLPEIRTVNGYTNVVLALWKEENYCESNRYIPMWSICNTEYYNENLDEFQGWIELEDNFPVKE